MQWDPALYLRYGDERLRPALDLLARIDAPAPAPAHVVDLGCGPGNVTTILKQRWPAADVLGIDGSAPMLDKARAAAPHCRFEQADFGTWTADTAPNVIYTNAALHWLGGHDTLFPRLFAQLAPLPPDLRAEFLAAYTAAVAPHYPRRPDGTTLLPFRRLFILARR